MPAASMKVLSPMASAHDTSQVARNRDVSRVPRSAPPATEATSPQSHVAPRRRVAPDDITRPGEVGRREQATVVTGEDRDHPWAFARNLDEHPARARRDIAAAHRAQVRPHQPCPCSKANECPEAHLARLGRLGIGQGQVGLDLCGRVGRLGLLPRQRDRAGRLMGQHGPGEGAQVRAHRAHRGRAERCSFGAT